MSANIAAATTSMDASSRATISPSLLPNWPYSEPEVRSARSAMASTDAPSMPCSAMISAAARRSRALVSTLRA